MHELVRTTIWTMLNAVIRLQFPQVRSISAAALAAWLHSDREPPVLLDARTPEEYQVSHLCQARLVFDRLETVQQTVAATAPIVTYCTVGYRSAALARQLQRLGYQQVFNLTGSIVQWANQGYPVYRNGQPVHQVHAYSALWAMLLKSDLHPQ
jgi:rhodanese-related sulfurtransferase